MILLVASGCGGCGRAPAPATPWQPVADALYLYPETIDRYAPDDRGGYVVTPPGAVAAADPDDVTGDGVAVRLGAAEVEALRARPGVTVAILQPAARRGAIGDEDVRIDLFGDASDAERDAVAAWLEQRGATVTWRGPAALRAHVAPEVAAEAARLGPVRWVE